MRRLLTEGMNAVYLKNLDEKDNQIIALLLENARLTYSEIGEQIGLSRVAVKNRVKLLEEQGIINGYHAQIDPLVVPGMFIYMVFIETEPGAYSEIAEHCKAEPMIRTLFATEGISRMQAICVAESTVQMRQLMRAMRDNMPGLTHLSYYSVSEIMKGKLLP